MAEFPKRQLSHGTLLNICQYDRRQLLKVDMETDTDRVLAQPSSTGLPTQGQLSTGSCVMILRPRTMDNLDGLQILPPELVDYLRTQTCSLMMIKYGAVGLHLTSAVLVSVRLGVNNGSQN